MVQSNAVAAGNAVVFEQLKKKGVLREVMVKGKEVFNRMPWVTLTQVFGKIVDGC